MNVIFSEMTGLSFGTNGDTAEMAYDLQKPNIRNYIHKKNNGETVWCDIPALLEQLPKNKIDEDLNILESAVVSS